MVTDYAWMKLCGGNNINFKSVKNEIGVNKALEQDYNLIFNRETNELITDQTK